MPDIYFDDLVAEEMPKVNEDVLNGLATLEMKNDEAYLDQIWRSAQGDFPPELKYKGIRRLKYTEEYTFLTKRGNSVATLEIARTTSRMVAFELTWNGEPLPPCHVSLPIVEDGGLTWIRGARYAISPVMADKAYSVGLNYVFVPLERDRITFERLLYHFRINGAPEARYVVWSAIHHKSKNKSKSGGSKLVAAMAHYLFARFGVVETFKRYADADIVIGTQESINTKAYPTTEWTHLSSLGQRPIKLKNKNYTPPNVVIAVRNTQVNETVINLAAGFFYAADYLPHRITAEDADEQFLWKVLIGVSIFGAGMGDGQAAKKAEEHLDSLDTHVVDMDRRRLKEGNILINDIYDLFVYLIDNMPMLLIKGHENLPSMYEKRLMVLEYVMKDLRNAINMFMYRVKPNPAGSQGQTKKPLTAKDAGEKLNESINPGIMSKLTHRHGEVDSSSSSPGDNKFFKITSTVRRQVNSSGRRGRGISINDPSNFLHCSILECGNFLTPSGSSPSGHERINPCIRLSPDRAVERNPDLIELLDDVQRRIRRI